MDILERDRAIRESDEHWSELAARYGLSRSSVFRIRSTPDPAPIEAFAPRSAVAGTEFRSRRGNKDVFSQIAVSGLTRHGGAVTEEFQRELQSDGGAKLYAQMATHPVVAAVLFAIRMSLRRVRWWFEPAADDDAARADAEFAEGCRTDMSQAWSEVMSQAFGTMLKHGYSLCELVYKLRLGQSPRKYVADPARSRYTDGRIGWRRWQFINPTSLAAGNQWEFDDYGRVQAINQTPPPDYKPRRLPMERMLLFRTEVEFDNPHGRALTLSTPVPTPNGWSTMGNLQVGDMVYGGDGKIRHVIAKSEIWHERPIYEIALKDGTTIQADSDHLWRVTNTVGRQRGYKPRIISTKAMYDWQMKSERGQFFSLGITPVLEAPILPLPIDGYVLGYWLGDGAKNGGSFGVHPDDYGNFEKQMQGAGFDISYNGREAYVSGLKVMLRAAGVLENKHIPQAYLRASPEQRLGLLQGLMDSDGTSNGAVKDAGSTFYNSNERIIAGTRELMRTLGSRVGQSVYAYAGEDHDICGRTVTCSKDGYALRLYSDFPLHRMPRKMACQSRAHTRRVQEHYVQSIKPAGVADTVCIETDDPENMFLVGEAMVPTHNSVLRPMYQSWYYATQLAEIEAIGAERLGVGFPIAYMGTALSRTGANSDLAALKDFVVNLRTDEQMGIVVPYPKMGSGDHGGQDALIELLSPPSRGFVDFGEVIGRWEQRMAMTALAQFIFLGMQRVGTQALASTMTDLFTDAIGAWSDAVADVISRFAIPRLFALNGRAREDLPELRHSEVGVPNLSVVSDYINKLVGAQVVAPYPELERHLLELADLPDRPEKQTPPTITKPASAQEPEEGAEEFALRLKQGGPKWERATNEYQRQLQDAYDDWADETARELAKIADEEERRKKLEKKITALVLLLLLIGREELPKALAYGSAGDPASPDGLAAVAAAVAANESYLQDSLGPAIRDKVLAGWREDPLGALDEVTLRSLLGTFFSRVGQFAGAFWELIMRGFLDRLRQRPDAEAVTVRWVLDPGVIQHCPDCLEWAGVYDNYQAMLSATGNNIPGAYPQCNGNCRCHLEFKVPGKGWGRW